MNLCETCGAQRIYGHFCARSPRCHGCNAKIDARLGEMMAEGFTAAEAGEEFGLSAAAVHKRLSRLRRAGQRSGRERGLHG